jgi:hypothetical protein
MIVFQKCHIQGFERESARGELGVGDADPRTTDGAPWSGMVGLSGMDLTRRSMEWVVSQQGVRSLSFPHQIIMVPRDEVERFVVSYLTTDVFSLWIRGRFRFPTRIPQRRLPAGLSQLESTRPAGATTPYAPQNMEMGSAFGTVPQEKMVTYLRRLGYVVDECPWSEMIR